MIYDSEETEDTMQDLFLIFTVKNRDYGIEIRYLIEIIAMQPITEIMNLPVFIKGVINLRGKIIPVIDVRLRFGLDFIDYHDRTCILIVSVNDLQVGLIVDSVKEVLRINKNQIEEAPNFGDFANEKLISAVGKVGDSLKILLNLEKLVYDKNLEHVAKLLNTGSFEQNATIQNSSKG